MGIVFGYDTPEVWNYFLIEPVCPSLDFADKCFLLGWVHTVLGGRRTGTMMARISHASAVGGIAAKYGASGVWMFTWPRRRALLLHQLCPMRPLAHVWSQQIRSTERLAHGSTHACTHLSEMPAGAHGSTHTLCSRHSPARASPWLSLRPFALTAYQQLARPTGQVTGW